jgi:thiamine-phosphate pyrophosphorylase
MIEAWAGTTGRASVRASVRGLYAVTPDLDDTALLATLVSAALRGGAGLVQYRNKTAGRALRAVQAARLADCCAESGRPLIVNDHVDLALSLADAGLHVGREDAGDPGALRHLRERLGPSRLLGVSCYRSLPQARAAVDAGADYIAFGSMFPSTTKSSAPCAPATLFEQARGLGVPMVAIGGITAVNLRSLVDAGCDAAAVIADLFASHDPAAVEASAHRLAAAFTRTR